jgi:hypothetical protein
MLEIDVRKYDWYSMARGFQTRRVTDLPEASILHAIHDVRVPLLTVCKAAEINGTRLNPCLVPENDIFPYLWGVVNRCMSVSPRVVAEGLPGRSTVTENWTAAAQVTRGSSRDLNLAEEMEKIVESQWDFCARPRIHPKQTHAEKKVCRSVEGLKHENKKNRIKQKLRKKRKREEAEAAANIEQ